MHVAPRSTPLVASLLLAAGAAACASSSRQLERQKCRAAFEACAPPARFDERTDLSKLTMRNLVQLSARLDVSDKLARKAANRLKGVVTTAGEAQLLEIESALEDTESLLAKCSCGDKLKAELYAQGIPELLRTRLPPREMRSPELWADRIFAGLAAIRELRRSSATALVEGGGNTAAKAEAPDAGMSVARRNLCIAVHGARAALPPQAFAAALEMVNHKESVQAGEGSAAASRQMLADIQELDTCGPEEAEPEAP